MQAANRHIQAAKRALWAFVDIRVGVANIFSNQLIFFWTKV